MEMEEIIEINACMQHEYTRDFLIGKKK